MKLKAAHRLLEAASDEDNERMHQQALEETGFWGKRGAGCIVLAKDTGRILLPYRSEDVQEPHTWGTWGGALDEGEKPDVAVRRELKEESGYKKSIQLYPLLVFRAPKGSFTYYNYLAVVAKEFTPRLDWETESFKWVTYGKWPDPLHPGLRGLLSDKASLKTIESHVGQQP